MRVAAFIYWNLGVQYLKILLEAGHEIVSVITVPDNLKMLPEGYSVEEFAYDNLIPLYKPSLNRINSPEFIDVLKRLKPDLIVVCYFPKILCSDILNIPRLGCINTHPSLLPKDRGMFPVFMPIIRRDRTAGITIFSLNPGIDTGDIITQRSFTLEERETGLSITEKLCSVGAELFKEILPLVEEGKAPRKPQNKDNSTYFSWKSSFARIDWGQTTEEIDALIRALGGLYGGAYSFLERRKVIFNSALPVSEYINSFKDFSIPGQLVARSGLGYLVKTGDGLIEIIDIKYEDNKKPTIEENLSSSNLKMIFS